MGNVSGEQSIVEMFSATNWSDIIEEGALSPYGSNYISWIDEVDRQISKSDRITIRRELKNHLLKNSNLKLQKKLGEADNSLSFKQ